MHAYLPANTSRLVVALFVALFLGSFRNDPIPDPQGTGQVDMLTHPYTTIACAAGVVTGTAGRDS